MRSRSMQFLTDAVKRRHPGVVIYGKGDAAHALHVSDHNEDDTPGSKPEQTDADSTPEHRAIDIMLGPAFTRADAYELIDDLLGDPAALARLTYLIFDGWIWSASRGWVRREFDGDDHSDHVHASGRASADENAAGWPAVEGDDMEQTEKLAFPTGNANRNVGQVLADLSNLRDWLYTVPGGKSVNPPPPGSNAVLLVQAAQRPVVVADVDEAALAAALAPLLETGATPAEVAAAVRAEIDKTRLGGS